MAAARLAPLALRAIGAVVAVVTAIWVLFYIDRIPVARVRPAQPVIARPGSVMAIGGLAGGDLMTLTFRAAGRVRLTTEPGARLVRPSAAEFAAASAMPAGAPPPGKIVVDVFKAAAGAGAIDFVLHAPEGRTGSIVLDPVAPTGPRRGFRLSSRDAPIEVGILMTGASNGGAAGNMTLFHAGKAIATDEASLLLPIGASIEIMADLADDPTRTALIVELPERRDKEAPGVLAAGAVAVGDPAARNFQTMVCGAARGRNFVLTPLIFPRLKISECTVGAVTVSDIDPFHGIRADVSGRAFHRHDGRTDMWDGPATFLSNKIVGAIFEWALKLLLVGFAAGALRALWKEVRRRV